MYSAASCCLPEENSACPWPTRCFSMRGATQTMSSSLLPLSAALAIASPSASPSTWGGISTEGGGDEYFPESRAEVTFDICTLHKISFTMHKVHNSQGIICRDVARESESGGNRQQGNCLSSFVGIIVWCIIKLKRNDRLLWLGTPSLLSAFDRALTIQYLATLKKLLSWHGPGSNS